MQQLGGLGGRQETETLSTIKSPSVHRVHVKGGLIIKWLGMIVAHKALNGAILSSMHTLTSNRHALYQPEGAGARLS